MIVIKDLSVRLGRFKLKDINAEIREGEYFVIVGPTGAGKTVLLETIAGLHPVQKGSISIDGLDMTAMPPEKRLLGYMPQDYALFPFLNVRENIAFGLERTNRPMRGFDGKVDHLAHILGITHLLDRNVKRLSGGEKQRVALARALAPEPRMLLLDEPMSSLDVRTAKYLRLELKRIHNELGITSLHVTHNLLEARELADRMAIMNQGEIEQIGTFEEVMFSPDGDIVMDFIGKPNILICEECRDLSHGLIEAICGDVSIVLPHEGRVINKIAFLPGDVYISKNNPPGPGLNRFKCTVSAIHTSLSLATVEVELGKNRIVAEMPKDILEESGIEVGQEVFLILKLRSLRVY
jgi:ABC-type sugar transport system ATPase subunit